MRHNVVAESLSVRLDLREAEDLQMLHSLHPGCLLWLTAH